MEIAVAGTGYVGLVTGVCLASKGHHVTCVDVDEQKLAMLNEGRTPIYEPGLQELMEENPGVRITVIDSLAASLGEGLLVHKAVTMRDQGKSYDEVVNWLEENKLHLVHNFTVDDLFHLHRGGRVSKATAILGTMINIKPILHVDDEGHLIAVGKVRGRKKSLTTLVDNMEKQIGSYRSQNDIVMISHGDCLEDAEYVKKLVEERFGIHEFLIHYVGPTIGAHSGPGTIALFYLGEYR